MPFISVYKVPLAITSANKGKIKGNKKQQNNITNYIVELFEMLVIIKVKGLIKMRMIHAWYNIRNNCIEINIYEEYILRIDCNKAEDGLQTTPWSQHCLDALALDNPLTHARLVLDGEIKTWVGAQDS